MPNTVIVYKFYEVWEMYTEPYLNMNGDYWLNSACYDPSWPLPKVHINK